MLKQRRNALRIILSIGGLSLFAGMTAAIVVLSTKSTSVSIEKIAVSVNDIPNITPDTDGEFSEEFTGWDFIAVGKDSIGETSVPKLTHLYDGYEYRLQFILQTSYIAPVDLTELAVDQINDRVYYSDILIFNLKADNLTAIDSIVPSSGGSVVTPFKGWEIVTINENGDIIKELELNSEYSLKFSLIEGYGLDNEVTDNLLTKIETDDGIFYETGVKTFSLTPSALISSEINKVEVYSNGVVTKEFTGYEISVVDPLDFDVELTLLNAGKQYVLIFALIDGYSDPISNDSNITGLTYDVNNKTFFSELRTFSEKAQAVNSILSVTPTSDAIIEGDFTGWNISVIDAVTELPLISLIDIDEYRLLFTLKPNYYAPDELSGLTINGDNYISETIVRSAFSAQVLEKEVIENLISSNDAIVNAKFLGWDAISVVSDIKNSSNEYDELSNLSAGSTYKLKFTLSNEYIVSATMNIDFLVLENSSYYTTKTYIKTENAQLIDESIVNSISPSSEGVISESFTGWEITVVDSIISNQVLISLDAGDLYQLRFTLKSGYLAPALIGGLTLSENDTYYSAARNYAVSAEDISTLDNIIPSNLGIVSETFIGWTVNVVSELNSIQLLSPILANDLYFLKFTLKLGYLEPTVTNALTFSEDGSYYSVAINYTILADSLNDIANVVPNSDGNVLESFTGWEIDVVDSISSNQVLDSLSANDSYLLKFTLKPGYLEPALIDELIQNENGSYYSIERNYFAYAGNVNNLDSVIPNNLGIIDITFFGWDISVVDSINLDQSLDTLDANDLYVLRFNLKPGYLESILIDGLTKNDNGSYYSDVKTYTIQAVNINDISSIIPNEFGIVSQTIIGWDIVAVNSISASETLNSLSANDSYLLKFTLKPGYLKSDEIGELISANDSYYSNSRTYTSLAADINDLSSIIPNEMGVITELIIGWDIEIVDAIGSSDLVGEFSLDTPTTYVLKFTLKPGYLEPTIIIGLSKIDNFYYSVSRINEVLPGDVSNLDNIIPNELGLVMQDLSGWEIEVVEGIGSSNLTGEFSLNEPTNYALKFSLKTNYLTPSNIGELILLNGFYYSMVKTYAVEAAGVSGIDTIIPSADAAVSIMFRGWTIEIVSDINSTESLTSLAINDLYYFKFILLDGFLVPNEIDELVMVGDAYYSTVKTHTNLPASVTNIDNIVPNELGVITQDVAGWDIDVVDAIGSSNLVGEFSSVEPTDYVLKFTLKSKFRKPDDLGELVKSGKSYYSILRTYSVVAMDIIDLSSIFPSEFGLVNELIRGWDIEVVENIGSNTLVGIFSQIQSTEYALKFSLKPNFLEPSSISDLVLNANGSYYSNTRIYLNQAQNIINISEIIPNEDGIVIDEFYGWKVEVVKGIGSDELVGEFKKTISQNYSLKFTLNPGFLPPSSIGSLIFNSNGSYYSFVVLHLPKAQEIEDNIEEIFLDVVEIDSNTAKVSSWFYRGWDVTIRTPGYATLSSISPGDIFVVLFELRSGFAPPNSIGSLMQFPTAPTYYRTSSIIFTE